MGQWISKSISIISPPPPHRNMDKGLYQLLSSTRFDPFLATLSWNNDLDGPCSFFLLPYHFDRLASAAKAHKWDHAASILSYSHLKSACLDTIISEQRLRQNGSGAFRVNIYLIHIPSGQIQFLVIDPNYALTRWSNRRDCNPYGGNLHCRSDFTVH